VTDDTKTKKKPRVLKRQGQSIEESVLFHDDMDEELLEKIEKSLSSRKHKIVSQAVSASQKKLVLEPEEDDPKGRELIITVEEKKRGEKTLDLPEEEPDGQSPPLENISEVTVSLDDDEPKEEPEEDTEERSEAAADHHEGRRRRGLLYWMFLLTCFFSGMSAGLWLGQFSPRPVKQEIADVGGAVGSGGGVHVVQDLYLPLDHGEKTLYLGLVLRIRGPNTMNDATVTAESLRGVIYEASRGLEPSDLLGYQGMRRLKARVEDLMRQRFPAYAVQDLTFLNYVIL
jgi:hypothetical protein